MSRRPVRLAAAAFAGPLVVMSLGGIPAAADNSGLALVIPALAPMLPGQQGWVSALWEANHDVCNVQVIATGPGLKIAYPANTGPFSSLYTSNGLAKTNVDYSALNIAVDHAVTAPVTVTLTVSWQALPPNVINKNDDLKTKKFVCTGDKGSQTITATLPVSASTGAAVIQKTTTVAVPRSTPSWVTMTFRGTKPGLANFRVTLAPPAGMTVSYPGDASSAGVNGAPTLAVGQDDYVAVRLDASGLATGVYQVPVTATDLTQRLRTDPAFNARVIQQLQTTCHPPTSR
jgi:hypothetical protein